MLPSAAWQPGSSSDAKAPSAAAACEDDSESEGDEDDSESASTDDEEVAVCHITSWQEPSNRAVALLYTNRQRVIRELVS